MTKRRGIAGLLAAAVLLAGCAGSKPAQADANEKPVVLAYYTDESDAALERYHRYFTGLATDTLSTDGDGNLVGEVPEEALDRAADFKLQTWALVSNYGESEWDPDIAHRVLTDPGAKSRLIGHIRDTVLENGYAGINLDFEAVRPEDRGALSLFVRDTARELRKHGKSTMISVPAKASDDPEDDWTGAFDYAAIGKYADLVQLMTYDEYGKWSEPGTSAGLDWIESTLKYSASKIKPSKLLMGMPAYANDWNLSNPSDESGFMITWTQANKLASAHKNAAKRDSATASMVLRYTAKNGDKHVVWYEDAYSVKVKTRLVGKYKLAGTSVYALGMEDGSFWTALNAGLK
ncbi:glycosyl hydrolase family 18 protein [Saccharibacillus sp. CPCC 101409]|uniref:glycosyl hydrolase family 18 protein n=1 Tax=Saccharibacillus sp. CPCC 101409 TaxID=3058041 RepID=UPI0026728608|nr:glycosyl hydrolase family 18 protein [Saccharibacillus sp. CPCC 101409]MDO3409979.1 glycosyl hydrolase family 18 protein [Saccharibacillus sp. CPCC 101409]